MCRDELENVRAGIVLPLLPKQLSMRALLESDTGFYYLIGLFTIAVFLVSLAALAILGPAGLGAAELGGLVVGFLVFMLVYFISIAVHRLEEGDGT
ncbi:hypothetical protein C494_04815 [Natronorubrum bangense JCM 10635]|uniref:Uncharacterized protein n=2 Tax=Natronorubrum bangense TaxID=61858 RepID=L9WMQ4_9EURY|nr:hypothetical protein C494_04815 [Natronorubrum bangense JCM 10635]